MFNLSWRTRLLCNYVESLQLFWRHSLGFTHSSSVGLWYVLEWKVRDAFLCLTVFPILPDCALMVHLFILHNFLCRLFFLAVHLGALSTFSWRMNRAELVYAVSGFPFWTSAMKINLVWHYHRFWPAVRQLQTGPFVLFSINMVAHIPC